MDMEKEEVPILEAEVGATVEEAVIIVATVMIMEAVTVAMVKTEAVVTVAIAVMERKGIVVTILAIVEEEEDLGTVPMMMGMAVTVKIEVVVMLTTKI